VEYEREDELIVHCDGHVARLMKRWGDGPHSKTKIHTPQKEQEFSCLWEIVRS